MRYILNERRAVVLDAVKAAPDGYVCEIKDRTRTADQNAALHAILTDISAQKVWAGKKRSVEDWKALMVSAHRIAQKEGGEIIPGIEGEFVQLRKSTTAMGVRELSSLIEYILAWCADNCVRLPAVRNLSA